MENQTQTQARPTFLTVICIISFVGLGLSIINNLFSIAFGAFSSTFYPFIQDGMEQALNEVSASDPAASAFMEQIFSSVLKVFEVMPILASIGLALAIVALVGVIMMWNLKKTGFYLYSGAKVIMIFYPMILIGVNFITTIAALSGFVVAAVFITMYALNLRSMK